MKTPRIPLDRMPEIVLKAKLCQATLEEFRTLLGLPKETSAIVMCRHIRTLANYQISPSPSQYREEVRKKLRPKLVEAVAIVMGGDTLTADDVLVRLAERGWEPGATNKRSYISYTLSDNPDVFRRDGDQGYAVYPKALEENWESMLYYAFDKFPSNRDLIESAAPKALREKLSPKSSRDRLANIIAQEVRKLSSEEQTTWLMTTDPSQALQKLRLRSLAKHDSDLAIEAALADLGLEADEAGEGPFNSLN